MHKKHLGRALAARDAGACSGGDPSGERRSDEFCFAAVWRCYRENRKAQGKIDDEEELDDGKSFASFVSGMSNTSAKLRKLDSLADSSLKSYANVQRMTGAHLDLSRSDSALGPLTGGLMGKMGLRSNSMGSSGVAKRPGSVKSLASYNTLVGMKQSQLRAQGVWVPKVRPPPFALRLTLTPTLVCPQRCGLYHPTHARNVNARSCLVH